MNLKIKLFSIYLILAQISVAFSQNEPENSLKNRLEEKRHFEIFSKESGDALVDSIIVTFASVSTVRESNEYDLSDRLVSKKFHLYVPLTNKWESQGESQYTYDNENRLLTNTSFVWIQSRNSLQEEYKIAYHYGPNIEEHTKSAWDVSNEEWLNISRTRIIFNNEHLEKEIISFNWDGLSNKWIRDAKTVNFYFDGDLNYTITSTWAVPENKWIPRSRTSYIEEDGTSNSMIILDEWNENLSEWRHESRTLTHLNANKDIETTRGDKWNTETNSWDNSFKIHAYLNDDELVTSSIQYNWNKKSESWLKYRKNSFSYESGSLVFFLSEEWNGEREEWYELVRAEYYLRQPVLSLNEGKRSTDLSIFPNPAQNVCYIEEDGSFEYSIRNTEGEMLLNGNTSANKEIDISKLSSGIYFIYIYSEAKNKIAKITKY